MKLRVKAAMAFVAWLAILLSLLCGPARAAGTVQQQPPRRLGQQDSWVIEFDWTGDAVTGSVPNTATALSGCDGLCQGYLVTQIETIPKTPAPSTGYSVTYADQGGVDFFAGTVSNLSASAAQSFPSVAAATPITGSPILSISGTVVAGAQGTVLVFIRKPGPINPVGGSQASPNWVTIANSPFADIRTFGAKCDGTTDDSTAINNAVNALPSTGGIVFIPARTSGCAIANTVAITKAHVTLLGAGADMGHDVGAAVTAASRLVWTGANNGTMVQFATVSGAATQVNSFSGFEALTVDCAGLGGIGVQFLSTFHSFARDYSIRECQIADLDTNVVAQVGDLGINGNAVKSLISTNGLVSNYQTTNGKNGVGVRLGGSSTANTNYVTFYNLRATQTNAPCMSLLNADSSWFYGIACGYYGSGSATAGILLDASQVGSVVLDNHFIGLEPGAKGLIQQNGALNTEIIGLIIDNASPIPKSALTNNGFGGLVGTLSVCSQGGGATSLCTVGPAFNAAGPFTRTVSFPSTASASFTATAGNNMVNAILTVTANSAIAITTDTATNICNAIGNPQTANGSAGPGFDWWVRNTGNNTATITAGSGVTFSSTNTITTTKAAHFVVVPTSCATGSQAVTVFTLGQWPA